MKENEILMAMVLHSISESNRTSCLVTIYISSLSCLLVFKFF